MEKKEIGKNVCRIEVDGSYDPCRVPIPERVDLWNSVRYRIEDKDAHRIAQNRDKVKDRSPGMTDFDSFLLAIIHTPQAVLTIVFPVGARVVFPFHDDRTVRA